MIIVKVKGKTLTPYIYLVAVVRASQNEFRCSVVSAYNVGSIHSFIIKNFGASEIAYFNNSIICEQNILRFEITMTDFLCMNILHTFEDLFHVVLHLINRDVLFIVFVGLDSLLLSWNCKTQRFSSGCLAFFVLRIVDVKQFDNIRAIF